MIDRTKLAKLVYIVDAVLGILSIGGAALYGVTYSSGNAWAAFAAVFVPGSLLWSLFCYGAYLGLRSDNVLLKVVFWVHVMGNFFGFPVGTAIAGMCVWLRRELGKHETRPAHA